MPVYFMNNGHIDLDVIRTMGVSVKDNDNPIGYFGTGLKFAIATLLRTGHEVSLRSNGETLRFTARPKEIRGKEFKVVYMDDEQLAFTTDLGKDWEVWQAYRELYSNCLDENGKIAGRCEEGYDTVISVHGEQIVEVHAGRGSIFLQGDPWIVGDGIEVYRGESQHLYYRGVRAAKLPRKSRFTYNFTTNMRLTEDRTLASMFDAVYKLSMRLPRITDPTFCARILEPDPHNLYFEGNLEFEDCGDPSEEFLDVLEKLMDNVMVAEKRKNMVRRHRKVKEFDEFQPSDGEMEVITEACDMLRRKLNAIVFPHEIKFVESLGPNVMAMARDDDIYITRRCLANGRDFLMITLYEEWIHLKFGYPDESRGMQQFLFDKILELVKE